MGTLKEQAWELQGASEYPINLSLLIAIKIINLLFLLDYSHGSYSVAHNDTTVYQTCLFQFTTNNNIFWFDQMKNHDKKINL